MADGIEDIDAIDALCKARWKEQQYGQIRSVVVEGDRQHGYKRVQILFGTNHFLVKGREKSLNAMRKYMGVSDGRVIQSRL